MKYIRAIFRYILFLTATFGIYGFWFFTAPFIKNKISWRQTIFQTWAQSFVSISNMKIEVIGKPPTAPFFLVCNHLSYTDVPALRVAAKGVFVAKGEIENWFLAGKIVRDMGTIFINRSNRRDIPRAGAEITKRLEQGEGVIVFPEGTSTKGETVLPFNSSFLEFAAKGDLPVSYASITYAMVSSKYKVSDFVTWWDEKTFAQHLWYLFQVREFTAIINFGENSVYNKNRKELATTLWQNIKDIFIPVDEDSLK